MLLRLLTLLALATTLASCHKASPATSDLPQPFPEPPVELLRYRNDSANPIDAGGILATDTLQVYRDIESYPLIRAVILDVRAEEQVLPFAIERALLVAGPGKVFADVQQDAARQPELFASGERRKLLDRSREAHVWVSGSAFIDEKDMPRSDARKIFRQMTEQVHGGTTFDEVYTRTLGEHSYDDGTLRRTRIGNYGDWVVSLANPTGAPFRAWTSVPKPHIEKLLAAEAGEMLILEDDDGDEPRLILYFVREVYRPG